MGRITVSLPDDLQTQLDAYAQAHSKAVSQVVAEAIRSLLSGAADPAAEKPAPAAEKPAPTPAPQPSAPAEGEDWVVRRYIEDLLGDLKLTLSAVNDLCLMMQADPPHEAPYNLPDPPWVRPRRRR